MGDEQSYLKHIKKAAAAGNSEGQALQGALEWYEAVRAEVQDTASSLRTLGRESVANMLLAITAMPSLDHMCDGNWNTCSVAGVVSARTLVIPVPAAESLHIDERFHFFVRALWVVWHFRDLERSRAVAFESTHKLPSIEDRIRAFLGSPTDAVDHLSVYTRCFEYVLGTIRATLARTATEIEATRST